MEFPKFNQNIKLNIPEPEYEFPTYENSIFKDMAEDIKQSQKEIDQKIELIISESQKSETNSNRISILTLIVGILTLIATVAGIIIQFL